MLSTIFGSPQTAALTRFFVNNAGKQCTAVETANALHAGLPSIKRSLGVLLKAGVIVKGEVGYCLPSTFPLLLELQSLFLKSEVLLGGQLVQTLKRLGDCGLIVLTGRFVMRADVAIDLLIIGSLNRPRFATVMHRFEREGLPVNYSILSRKQFQERWSITDRFLYSIFEGRHEILLDKWGLVSVRNEEVRSEK